MTSAGAATTSGNPSCLRSSSWWTGSARSRLPRHHSPVRWPWPGPSAARGPSSASAAPARVDPVLAAANLELTEDDLATIEGKD